GSKMYENHQGYELIGLSPGGEIFDNGKQFDVEELAVKLVASHKACFAYPHDPNQQTVQGMIEILMNNPNVIAFTSAGEIAAVGVMERDNNFAQITQVSIYEPTFWTVPEHCRNGLSTGLRQSMMRLSNLMGNTLFYSESIRPTS